jgi:hypothetical protein
VDGRGPFKEALGTWWSPTDAKVALFKIWKITEATPLTYGGRRYPVLVIAFRSVATLMCGQHSPLKFNNTLSEYCSCRTSGPSG